MIVIVDSGVANLASVSSAFRRLKVETIFSVQPNDLRKADRVILPGVGAAAAGMSHLHKHGLVDVLRSLTQPVLGICLGMQLMFSHSEEGDTEGLGIMEGNIRRLKASAETPVPHMGWNTLSFCEPDHPLLKGIGSESFAYFVHSFAAPVADYTLASTHYGSEFSSIVSNRNFFGCQFHPERSSALGEAILKNFLDL